MMSVYMTGLSLRAAGRELVVGVGRGEGPAMAWLLPATMDGSCPRRPATFSSRRLLHQISHRDKPLLTNQQVRQRRCSLFEEEKKRQLSLIPRIEKIEVKYQGQPEDATLILNKNLSTPYNIAQHLTEMLVDRSALALVNGQIWDMHRPLEEDCTVELLHFHSPDPFHVNRAFWRSCSLLLSAALDSAFREDMYVEVHSFPAPNVASGSFVADVDLKLKHDWEPNKQELMAISAVMHRMAEKALKFERLVVDASVALEMFSDNQYKTAQIPSIAGSSSSGNKVTLYKVGDYIDISGGPMVAGSQFLGRRCTIPAVHKIQHAGLPLYRFQGVALPKEVYLNHVAFGILEKRAARLNMAGMQNTKPAQPV